MECRRIEIRAIGPDQCPNLGVETDAPEQRRLAKRAIQLALQYRFEIDSPGDSVFEKDVDGIGVYYWLRKK
ncbi:MAG: hypothetical protein BECKG1743D_GA0114223_112081 [Candidatus Kentron sp. G]|nr:MAG: hypothetical protein BECKG1743F_GA0114225_110561 [Candidatus Kentron sp. G]VFN07324.1 MAG: hypothetical protein BECKG1743E_GA0114224_111841 [Candidatus Kentron sp. G]VFN07949.1 MAG: hypothetical protein BECKG1743D_GA0114223_112081 [Candidatus Kentron sp. G]